MLDGDSLEAFARTFLLAAIRLRGAAGEDPDGIAEWYAEGLRAGPGVWPRPDRPDQAEVEAASIALGLHLSRPWLWDRLTDKDRDRLVDRLGMVRAGFTETITDELRTTSPRRRRPDSGARTASSPAVRHIYAAAIILGQDQIPAVRVRAATVEIRWTPGEHSRVELTDPPAARTSLG